MIMTVKNRSDEVIGWLGAVMILAAYALNNSGTITMQTPAYQLLNLFGALGIVYISLRKKASQPALLNLVWAAIAAIGVINMI